LAEKQGIPSYLVDGAMDIAEEWLEGCGDIGVTAGASAPESLVQEVIDHLKNRNGNSVEEVAGREENMEFALPRELRLRLML